MAVRHDEIREYLESIDGKKGVELTGLETFSIEVQGKTLNALTYAIYKRNLPVLKHVASILLLAEALCIQQMGPDQETSGCEALQKLDPSFTLKLALDTGDTEVFAFVLEIGCPYFSLDRFEEFAELVATQEDMIEVFADSPLLKRWLFSLESPLILHEEGFGHLLGVRQDGSTRVVVTNSKLVENALREAKKLMVYDREELL